MSPEDSFALQTEGSELSCGYWVQNEKDLPPIDMFLATSS
jgi:hypothetical protein